MILYLTAPFPKKFVYKNQAKERPEDLLIIPKFYLIILKRVLGEHFFLRGKRRIKTKPDIPDREALP